MRNSELTVLLAVLLTACGGGIVSVPRLTASHRVAASPEAVCQSLARAAFANGRELVVRQPERFAVRAAFTDRFGAHVLAVECLPGGVVTVRPYGPRVEPSSIGRLRTEDLMPERLHQELLEFTQDVRSELDRLESGAAPRGHEPPRRSRDPLPEEVAGIHPDGGIIATGGLSLAASYLVGSFTSLALTIGCGNSSDHGCGVRAAILSFIPLAHWSGFFGGWHTATGVVFSALELVSIIVLFAGAGHHRAGPVALSGPGTLTISF